MRPIQMRGHGDEHGAPVTAVQLRPDGLRVATASYDGMVKIWDTSDPTRPGLVATLRHRRLVNAVRWNPLHPERIATASADKTVAVWTVSDSGVVTLECVMARHTDDVNSVSWLPDGTRLACASEDGRSTLWEACTGRFLGELQSHAAHCMMVAANSFGEIATVGEDGMVAVSKPGSQEPDRTARFPSSVEGCSWSPKSDRLAVACDDGRVIVLNSRLETIAEFQVAIAPARCVEWSADGKQLVVGAYDGSVSVVTTAGQVVRTFRDDRQWPRSVSVAQGLVAVGSFSGCCHLYALDSGQPLFRPLAANDGPNAMATDSTSLYVGCDSGRVLVMPLVGETGVAPQIIDVADSPILSLAIDRGRIYAGTYSGRVVAMEAGPRMISKDLGSPLPSLCMQGTQVVAGSYSGEIITLDKHTLADGIASRVAHGSIKSIQSSRFGLVTASTDRVVRVGALAKRINLWEHGNLVNAVSLSEAGSVIASASRDHTVKVGRVAGDDAAAVASRLITLIGSDESVKSVCVLGSDDKPTVLAGSYDFTLYSWQVDWGNASGAMVAGQVVSEFDQAISCIARTGPRSAVVASWDGLLRWFSVASDGTLALDREVDLVELRTPALLAN